jgi:hypothetical protein
MTFLTWTDPEARTSPSPLDFPSPQTEDVMTKRASTPATATAIGVIAVTLLAAGGSRLFFPAHAAAAAASGGQSVTLNPSTIPPSDSTQTAYSQVTIAGGPNCGTGLLGGSTATLSSDGASMFGPMPQSGAPQGPWTSTLPVNLDSNGNGTAVVQASPHAGLQNIKATFAGSSGLLGIGGTSCSGTATGQLLEVGTPASVGMDTLNPNRLLTTDAVTKTPVTVHVLDASGGGVPGQTQVVLIRSSQPNSIITTTDAGGGTYTTSLGPAPGPMKETVTAYDVVSGSVLSSAPQTLVSFSSTADCKPGGVTFNPSTIVADGQSSTTATVKYLNGTSPASGEPVVFTGDPGLNISQNDSSTKPDGTATATLHAGYAIGSKNVTVNDPNSLNSCSAPVTISNGTPGTKDSGQTSRYVYRIYQDVLGRAGEDAGVNYWGNFVNFGGSRGQMALGLSTSPEYYTRILNAQQLPGGDKGMYEKYLGHPGDQDGINYWVGQMGNGTTDEWIAAQFLGSVEFFTNAGGNNSSWLDAVYQAVMGRSPDSAGKSYWLSQLNNGNMDRNQVAYQFVTSTEQFSMKVIHWYSAYLNRGPGSIDDVNYWVSALQNGVRDENVIANFTGSQEYFDHS